MPADRAARLARIAGCGQIALTLAPLTPQTLPEAARFDAVHPAPRPYGRFAEARAALLAARGPHRAEGVVLVGEAPFEAEWCVAGRLGYYLPADRFFPA